MKDNSKNGFKIHCIIMLVLVSIVFWQYLSGNKTFIFFDIASDSLAQTYPNLVYTAREIENGNFGNRWNYVSSIGNSAGVILPRLDNLEAFCGVDQIPYMMGFFITLKVFLAGIFFYLYLKKIGVSNTVSSAFSIFYAFCAHMIIRASWRSYPNEVLTLAIWLWAFEVWFKDHKKWWGVSLATAFFYYNCSGYCLVLYSGIFVVYAIFRTLIESDKIEFKTNIYKTISFAAIVISSLLISSVSWADSMAKQVKSDRLSNGVDKLSTVTDSAFFTSIESLKTAFYRTIGTDIIGINDYCGSGNFLEAAAFYCGLLTLLLVPTVYIYAKGRKKIAYSIGLIGIALYLLVRPIRFVANGFSGYGFKLSALWVMVLLIYIAASGFDNLIKNIQALKLRYLYITFVVIVTLSVLLFIDGLDYVKLAASLILLSVYVAVITLYKKKHLSEANFAKVILCVVVVEALITSYGCINNRETMVENPYNDGTQEALAYIDQFAGSENEFYRVDKQFRAVSFCDSLYQNFMGTVAYIGGSGDRKTTGDFYKAESLAILGGNNHDMTGFGISTGINTLMNVKYILSNVGLNTNFGYKDVGKIGDITVYQNQYSLPLGYVYDRYIALDDFLELSIGKSREVLLEACVLDGEVTGDKLSKVELQRNMISYSQYEIEAETETTDNWVKISLPDIQGGMVGLIALDVESDGSKSSMYEIYDKDDNAMTSYIGIADGKDSYYIECNDPNVKKVQIFQTGQYCINDISYYQIPQDVFYKSYMENCESLRRNGIQIEKIDSNMICGTIESDKNGMMTLSIPYDKNWHLYVDGEEKELYQVNIAMMGSFITAGTHKVELIYEKKNMWKTYVIIGIGVYAILALVGMSRKIKCSHEEH